ncbi:hypothetical protein UFOVP324_10 [uncultured Caudovirales phage]|uniref:Uncharacterized protein n=1 Tax=uncultured Caudovirales phage TaxID=2100421 RepID=A0A6J5LVH8_9CAUD|nr:hypothetical protein UFOVP324_10 [uncultured Caudovirales phage]
MGYYYIVDKLRTYLKATDFINTVTVGDLSFIDNAKQTIFPLSHIIVNNATPSEQSLSFNISILFMDIVDESKSKTIDVFEGNDNTHDVLNTQLELANKTFMDLVRGELYDDLVQINGTPTCEPFVDRFENSIAGWTLSFDVIIPNDMTIC